MSATLAPVQVRTLPATRRRTVERVFAGAAAIGALHWLDAAFVTPWRGEPARTGVPAAAVAVLLAAFAAFAAIAWPRLPRGPRALVAYVAGAIYLTAGGIAVWHVAAGDFEGGVWTGLLMVPAGLAAMGCAIAGLRGAPRRRFLHRWARRAGGAIVVVLIALWVVLPLSTALVVTGKPREAVPAGALGLPHEDVTFRSTDGLQLSGWYVPSRNGAAIVVVHGGGGSRLGAVRHARMLAAHGYGVLLYDERGRGESDGQPDAIGWTWKRDVAGALAWLERRPDVDPARIGGLGLSTGAEALVQAAAERRDLHAVVADGTEARSVTEAARVAGGSDLPYWTVLYGATRVLVDSSPAPDLGRLVTGLRAPTLLIAAGRAEEARFGRIYAARSGGRARLWAVPDAGHTQALRVHPAAYAARVTGFFDRALRPR